MPISAVFEQFKQSLSGLSSYNVSGQSQKDIKIKIIFSFRCPHCAKLHPIIEELRQEYADQIVFQAVHFPTSYEDIRVHAASEAAARQGKFWQMYNLLYEKREQWFEVDLANLDYVLETFAQELGLDLELFKADLINPKIREIIAKDQDHITDALKIRGTPTLLVNDQILKHYEWGVIEDLPLDQVVENARETLNKLLGD